MFSNRYDESSGRWFRMRAAFLIARRLRHKEEAARIKVKDKRVSRHRFFSKLRWGQWAWLSGTVCLASVYLMATMVKYWNTDLGNSLLPEQEYEQISLGVSLVLFGYHGRSREGLH